MPPNERCASVFDALSADPNQYQLVAERKDHVVGCLQITITLVRLGTWRGQNF
ncbi:hypothetical protein [Bradyrhizobium elkanii]|uniref:hypothetical protein n=1 Tax=Bradyrhizobium elkanii TaxID=29448 RepID=UPI003D1B0C04